MCCDDNKFPFEDDDNDDCHELDTLYDQIYEYDLSEVDVDDYWAKGWSINAEGLYRDDADVADGREVRVFPTRYRLKDFVFTDSHRRILKRNRDLRITIRPFRSTEGKDDLYTAHLHNRFQSELPRYSLKDRYQHIDYSDLELMETAVFNGEKLIACSIFLVGERSVVSSIGFWDVNEKRRGLGILTVLLEVQYALKHDKEFYYLGNYIRQDPNYNYKTRFPALELFDWDNECWVDYQDARIKEMFNHKFRCADDTNEKDPKFTVDLFRYSSQSYRQTVASALFGSRARGTEREDSDFNVLILTDDIESYLVKNDFPRRFHRWRESKIEQRGAVKVVRAFYKNGDVYEFNFAAPEWANTDSINEDTRRIVAGGMQILYDPQGILEKLQKAIAPVK